MKKVVECFYPGSSFPAVSVTGTDCALNCRHCSRKYLNGMIPATKPSDLLSIAEAMAERGASGFLLSGGVDRTGRVPLGDFAEAIREIKDTTDLLVNAHIGLSTKSEIECLVRSGVDSFSIDLYGSKETISEVLGLDASPDDFFRVMEQLMDAGAPVVAPHICVGIHGGEVRGEHKAVERLTRFQPGVLILISLIPTKGTPYEKVAPPGKDLMIDVIGAARRELPDTRLVLGCMRSKIDRSSEIDLIDAGLDGIVLPAATTVERMRERGTVVKKRSVCCSFL